MARVDSTEKKKQLRYLRPVKTTVGGFRSEFLLTGGNQPALFQGNGSQGALLPLRRERDIDCHQWEEAGGSWYLVKYRPGMLPNVLWCTGPPGEQRII